MLTHAPRTPERWSPLHSGRETQNYYVPRKACEGANCEDYWSPKADPSGNVRDRSDPREREQYLADLGQGELAYLQSLQSRSGGRRLRLFDLGAGPGWLLSALPDEHWDKWGVEICREAAQEARLHAEVICGDWRGTFDDEFFDVVFCHHVIEHLADPLDHVHEIRRVLKKGGKLILATPDFSSPCAKRFGERFRMLHDPTHISLFSLESMTRMLMDFGFTIEDVAFPFPERYATAETMEKWRRGPVEGEWSPPWPGNWMTFYCEK